MESPSLSFEHRGGLEDVDMSKLDIVPRPAAESRVCAGTATSTPSATVSKRPVVLVAEACAGLGSADPIRMAGSINKGCGAGLSTCIFHDGMR